MAWRWGEAETVLPRGFRLYEGNDMATSEPERSDCVPPGWEFHPYNADEGEPAGWIEPEQEYERRKARMTALRKGYCGIAGRIHVEPAIL